MVTKEDVLEVLANSEQPLRSAQVAEKLGVDKAEADKAIKALKAAGEIISPKACCYTVAL
ncbi:MAG: helix-turn-helix domain-containing protein [Propionibacteriaceae bacterium]|jgi:predicted transcriptional regulator|nr:helix-turn-helix domain-containing protein [Propionibacteriaceae bacterium]